MVKPITYPIRKFDTNGKQTYSENSNGKWIKWVFDNNGNITYNETSEGDWCKSEFDANGKITYWERSDGTVRGVTNNVTSNNISMKYLLLL
jgi:hypothetical protein